MAGTAFPNIWEREHPYHSIGPISPTFGGQRIAITVVDPSAPLLGATPSYHGGGPGSPTFSRRPLSQYLTLLVAFSNIFSYDFFQSSVGQIKSNLYLFIYLQQYVWHSCTQILLYFNNYFLPIFFSSKHSKSWILTRHIH